MLKLVLGKKGAGKTKKLIELANAAIQGSNGNVIVIEKGHKLTYDLSHEARLIDTEQYGIGSFEAFYGFICGICSGNYDVTDILIDSTLKIGGNDLKALEGFIKRLHSAGKNLNAQFVFSVSADPSELSDEIKSICTIV